MTTTLVAKRQCNLLVQRFDLGSGYALEMIEQYRYQVESSFTDPRLVVHQVPRCNKDSREHIGTSIFTPITSQV